MTGLFGGSLSTRLECGDWEKRNALIAKGEREKEKSKKRASSQYEASNIGPSKAKRPLTLTSGHPQSSLTSKEQKRRRLKLDLETFDDLTTTSPRRSSPRMKTKPLHAAQSDRKATHAKGPVTAVKPVPSLKRSNEQGSSQGGSRQGIKPQQERPVTAVQKTLSPLRQSPTVGNRKPDIESFPRHPPSASRPLPAQPSKGGSQIPKRSDGPSNLALVSTGQIGKKPTGDLIREVSKPLIARRSVGHDGKAARTKKDPSLLLSVQRGVSFYPTAPPRRPGTYRDDDEIDSDSEEDDGLIVSDEEEEDWRAEMRQVTRYDPRK